MDTPRTGTLVTSRRRLSGFLTSLDRPRQREDREIALLEAIEIPVGALIETFGVTPDLDADLDRWERESAEDLTPDAWREPEPPRPSHAVTTPW